MKSVISDEAVVNCVCIRPNGKIGFHPVVTRQLFLEILGIFVVDTRILGYERAYARSYPKILPLSRQILEKLFLLVEGGDWVRGESEDKSTVLVGRPCFGKKASRMNQARKGARLLLSLKVRIPNRMNLCFFPGKRNYDSDTPR